MYNTIISAVIYLDKITLDIILYPPPHLPLRTALYIVYGQKIYFLCGPRTNYYKK